MNTATESAAPNRDEELLGELMRQLSHDDNIEVILEVFCRRYPHLEVEARSYPKMQQFLQCVQPTETAHPKQLGDFRIIRQMARGGMGVIYEAIQERLKRRVVLKTMKASWDIGPARMRFRREQEVLARLHQTHIVPIHTADESDGLHYFVMPYIEGASLNHVVEEARNCDTSQADGSTTSLPAIAAAWLKKSGKHEAKSPPLVNSDKTVDSPVSSRAGQADQARRELPIHYFRSVAQAIADIAEGLHYAHQEGLLHRDLKPSNIMIEPSGKSWIIDFGLAGFLQQTEEVATSDTVAEETESLTHGHAIGTPAYMAPEQWNSSGNLDERTDVWGLGVTLYEMLTLHRPFATHLATDSTSQRQQLQELIVQERPQSLSHYVKNVPADLAAICIKAMEKEPGQRYPNAQAFAEDLRRWLRCEPVSARPTWVLRNVWLWTKRNRGWAATILGVLFAMVAVPSTFAYVQQQRSAELERESHIQQIMHVRFVNHQAGWSEDVKERTRAAARIGKTQTLTDEYAATLGFIDATMIKRFEGFEASGLAFDAKGERLLIGGGKEEKARLWHVKTGDTVQSQLVGPGPVAFGTNGAPLQLITKPDNSHSYTLWDMGKQQLVRQFSLPEIKGARTSVTALAADGSLVAVVELTENKGQVFVWDAASGKSILVTEQAATALAFSPDNKYLAVGMVNGIAVSSLATGKQLAFLPSSNTVQSLAFGRNPFRDGHPWRLAVGDAGSLISIWNLDKNLPVSFCRGSNHEIHSLAFNPDGVLLATAGRGRAKLWDVATGSLLLDLDVRNTMKAVVFSPDGRHLAVSSVPMWGGTAYSDRGGVDLWELQNNRGIQILHGLVGSIAKVCFSPKGRFIAVLSHDWQLGVWDAVSGRLQYIVDVPRGYWVDNCSLSFNDNTGQLAFSTGRTACLYDSITGQQLREWSLPSGLNDQITFHPSDKLLLFRNESEKQETLPVPGNTKFNICRIRDLLGQQPTKPLAEIRNFDLGIKSTSISPLGSFYVVSGLSSSKDGKQGMIKAFEGVSGKELWSLPFDNNRTDGRTRIDSTGRMVSCSTIELGKSVLVDLASGRILGNWAKEQVRRTFPNEKYWKDGITCHLFQDDNPSPLVKFELTEDYIDLGFNHAQTHLAIGNPNGTVSLINMSAVQKSLAKVGLGW